MAERGRWVTPGLFHKKAMVSVPVRRWTGWAKRLSGLLALAVTVALLAMEGREGDLGAPLPLPVRSGRSLNADPAPAEHAVDGHTVADSDHGSSGGDGHGDSHGDGHGGGEGCQEEHPQPATMQGVLAFLYTCFFACAIVDYFNQKVPEMVQLPLSVAMFLAGGVLGLIIINGVGKHKTIDGLELWVEGIIFGSRFDPHALLYMVLPPLLYESASGMSWHVLRKVLPSAILLAGPGVIIGTILTGIFVRFAFRVDAHRPEWSASMLLGAMLSATDPVAVVAALGALGAPAKLVIVVDGEALINDGSAVVVAMAARDWAMGADAPADEKFCPGASPSANCIFGYFCQVAGGGCGIGIAAGTVLYFLIGFARERNSVQLELLMVFSTIYTTFYLGEAAKTSGILATVVLGMFVTANVKSRLSPEAEHAGHAILGYLSIVGNQIIFFAAGLICVQFMWTKTGCEHDFSQGRAWLELIGLYIALHVIRALMILMMAPALTQLGYGLNWREAVICVYGGLRGGLALVMGLIMEHNQYLGPGVKRMLVFHTAGIVLLTLIINGTTVDFIYKTLKDQLNPYRAHYLRKFLTKFEADCQKVVLDHLHHDPLLRQEPLGALLRCLPDFRFVSISRDGLPVPDGVADVQSVLEDGADLDDLDLDGAVPSPTSPMSPDAHGAPSSRHSPRSGAGEVVDADERIWDLLDQQGEADSRDFLQNVDCPATDAVTFQPESTRIQSGFYLSAQSLKSISGQVSKNTDSAGFSFTLAEVRCVRVFVGLLHSSAAASIEAGKRILGVVPNSLALDCVSGCILYKGVLWDSAVPLINGSISAGDRVHISVQREQQEWSVTVRCYSGQTEELLGSKSCTFGDFPPEAVFPAIEFRRCNEAPMQQLGNGRLLRYLGETSPGVVRGLLEEDTSPLSPHVAVGHREPEARVPRLESAVVEAILDTERAAERAAERGASSERAERSPEPACHGHGHGDAAGEPPEPAVFGRLSDSPVRAAAASVTTTATVLLGFEAQLATGAETMNALLHVLFQMTMQKYQELHHEGLIGERALQWLSESVDEGADCADEEVNSSRASDLLRPRSRPQMRYESPVVTVACRSMWKRPPGIHEPLIVEYLSLRKMTSLPSWWDKLDSIPKYRSGQFGDIGYGRTAAKVEALWAFVHVHEEAAHGSPATDRFPGLLSCLHRLVHEAQRDLAALQAVEPQRFRCCRRSLVLRVALHERLLMLEKAIEAGWITKGEGEGLVSLLRDRIHEVRSFTPGQPASCWPCPRRHAAAPRDYAVPAALPGKAAEPHGTLVTVAARDLVAHTAHGAHGTPLSPLGGSGHGSSGRGGAGAGHGGNGHVQAAH